MTPREKLIQAIERSPDSIVQELLKVLESLEQKQLRPEVADSSQKTVLELATLDKDFNIYRRYRNQPFERVFYPQ